MLHFLLFKEVSSHCKLTLFPAFIFLLERSAAIVLYFVATFREFT